MNERFETNIEVTADINNVLSFLYNYKLVSQNNVTNLKILLQNERASLNFKSYMGYVISPITWLNQFDKIKSELFIKFFCESFNVRDI